MIQLAKRVSNIKPSPTLAVTAKAAELRQNGIQVIDLGVGEPDFNTPDPIKAAGIQAIKENHSRYTPVGGTPQLKAAVVNKLNRDNQLEYDVNQILVSSGAKHSIYNLACALLNPGDEAIIPAPYWVSYPDIVSLFDAIPIIAHTHYDDGFKLTPRTLQNLITEKTRLLFLNSPSNPTGVAYTRKELQALAEVIKEHPHITVLSDDIYEYIYWGSEPFCNIINVCPELKSRCVLINGVSKGYAMTGWRIGYAAGPVELIAAMQKIQSQSTSNPCSISQQAAKAALQLDRSELAPMIEAFKSRHDFLVEALNGLPGVRCLPGQGAFYAFPDISGAIERLSGQGVKNDQQFAEFLLEKGHIAAVAGSAFGASGCIRFSYATSMENLQKTIGILQSLLQG
ncbi:MAG: pyridoxal phosphate-dependent aminotransferase [Gammaproteobacteria bacterium]|nr:MAG: pyridoxal phosphate-dependent aminotransferase [Gammaproteobacteria bacterium]